MNIQEYLQDRYELLELIGKGGFGSIYRARQIATDQEVAVKVLQLRQESGAPPVSRQIERFRLEMQLCAKLYHPNIVRLLDFGQLGDNELFTVFEYVPGINLAEVLARERTLEYQEAIYLMSQVLDALHCAHNQNVVHRDLKPANIMITSTGARRNAMIVDFGIGKLIHDEALQSDLSRLTATYELIGTPAYAAPEQLRGEVPTTRSDLYAWGLVMLECLSGELVLKGKTPYETIQNQLSDTLVPIPQLLINHPLGVILQRATTKNVAQRKVSASSLLQELQALHLNVGSQTAEMDRNRAPSPLLPINPGELFNKTLTDPGERRQITALCCHLRLISHYDEELDAEEFERILSVQRMSCRQTAETFKGHIAGTLGDRIMLYFGYPQAYEHEAQQAVQAALAIQATIRQHSSKLETERGLSLDICIGIDTGIVVTREYHSAAHQTLYDVIGQTPEIAAQLDTLAESDSVLISENTQKLLPTHYPLESIGSHRLHGISRPLEVFRLVSNKVESTEVIAMEDPYLKIKLPLIGREQERDLLLTYWQQVKAGRGHSTLITGEAGIGKSRLVRELQQQAQQAEHTCLKCRCSAENQNKALRPLVEALEQLLIEIDSEPLTALEQLLQRYDFEVSETLPLLVTLLDLTLPESYTALQISPEKQKELTIDALLSLLFSCAQRQPLLLIIEDLHWADPSSLEVLTILTEEVAAEPLYVVFTARPEFNPTWSVSDIVQLPLKRLGDETILQMVMAITDGKTLPEPIIKMVIERTDGVALFVEELTSMLLESDILQEQEDHYVQLKPISELAIPMTLQGLLTTKLDGLGRAKSTAQLAATIGREFQYDLLAAISPLDKLSLEQDLDSLTQADLIYRRRRQRQATYLFKHALIRDSAYESMLQTSRQEVHKRVATTIEQAFLEIVETRPDLLAHHYAAAKQELQALKYSERAAKIALRRSEHLEAMDHANRALAWLSTIDNDKLRAETELNLNGIITPALMAIKGYSSPELEVVANRSQQLIDELGDIPQVYPTLWAIATYHHVRSNRQQARTVSERFVAVAEQSTDLSKTMTAYSTLSQCLLTEGKFLEAKTLLDKTLALQKDEEPSNLAVTYGLDALAYLGMTLSRVLAPLGFLDQALEQAERALQHAQQLEHANTIGLAQLYVLNCLKFREEREKVIVQGEETMDFSERYGLYFIKSLSSLVVNWAKQEDINESRKIIASNIKNGFFIGITYYRSLIAESEAESGDCKKALETVDRCLADVEQIQEYYYLSPLYCLKGRLLLISDRNDMKLAVSCFEKALSVAEKQQALSYQLAAATDLSQCLIKLDQSSQANEILSKIHDRFTEGFETLLLRKAQRLLTDLAN